MTATILSYSARFCCLMIMAALLEAPCMATETVRGKKEYLIPLNELADNDKRVNPLKLEEYRKKIEVILRIYKDVPVVIQGSKEQDFLLVAEVYNMLKELNVRDIKMEVID